MSRILAIAYGATSYLLFLASFLYAVGFVGDLLVPKSIDSGPTDALPASVLVDTLLLLLFAVPHSVMARPAFKRWWTRFVPPPVERSTYVLVSSLTLGFLFWQWRPIPSVLWHVAHPAGRWVLLAFWATPTMTLGHLLFAVATTAYILIALQLEERDLVAFHGEQHRAYQRQAGMLLPLPRSPVVPARPRR